MISSLHSAEQGNLQCREVIAKKLISGSIIVINASRHFELINAFLGSLDSQYSFSSSFQENLGLFRLCAGSASREHGHVMTVISRIYF